MSALLEFPGSTIWLIGAQQQIPIPDSFRTERGWVCGETYMRRADADNPQHVQLIGPLFCDRWDCHVCRDRRIQEHLAQDAAVVPRLRSLFMADIPLSVSWSAIRSRLRRAGIKRGAPVPWRCDTILLAGRPVLRVFSEVELPEFNFRRIRRSRMGAELERSLALVTTIPGQQRQQPVTCSDAWKALRIPPLEQSPSESKVPDSFQPVETDWQFVGYCQVQDTRRFFDHCEMNDIAVASSRNALYLHFPAFWDAADIDAFFQSGSWDRSP